MQVNCPESAKCKIMSDFFDEVINRENTNCIKWDYRKQKFGSSDIIPMWVADMDFKSSEKITKAIIKRAEHGIYGYTRPSTELSEAVCSWLAKRHNWKISKDWITYSPGVIASLNTAILAFSEPGDKILIQTPVYYPFFSSITDNKRQLVTNPLILADGNYEMDFDDLEQKFMLGIKLMILCSPHNPGGRVWKRRELEEVACLCEKFNVTVISDEIHFDIVYEGQKHIPYASISNYTSLNSITLISPTKTFNLAGLSQSCAIIQNEDYFHKFTNTIKKTGANMQNIFGMVAAQTAYTECENWLDDLIVYLQDNLNLLENCFKKCIPEIKLIRPQATYLAWLDCTDLSIPAHKLKEFFTGKAKVGLNDGITFGVEGAGFQRLNFACPRAVLTEGISRIEKAVREFYALSK